jgi:hypothetical protein
MPSVSGVTSRRRRSFVSSPPSPERMPPWWRRRRGGTEGESRGGRGVGEEGSRGGGSRGGVDRGGRSHLDGGAVRDGLVGVDALVRLLAVEEVLEELLHLGDARGAADEDDLVDLRLLELRVVQNLLDGRERLLEEVDAELLEARARQRLGEVDAVEEPLDLDADLVLRRERALGALDLAAELLDRLLVLRRVGAVLALEHLEQVLDHAVVEVLAAEVGVARRRDHLEDAWRGGGADCERREAAAGEAPPKRARAGGVCSEDASHRCQW